MVAVPRCPSEVDREHQSFARSLTKEAVQAPLAFRSTEAEPDSDGKFKETFPDDIMASAQPARSEPSTKSSSGLQQTRDSMAMKRMRNRHFISRISAVSDIHR